MTLYVCTRPDADHATESREKFIARFKADLQSTLDDAARAEKAEIDVLHIMSGVKKSFWEHLLFLRKLRVHNLPQKAQWACEALSAGEYRWRLATWRYCDVSSGSHPVIMASPK